MADNHIGDGESGFVIMNITPDVCTVGPGTISFEIQQHLSSQRSGYSSDVKARKNQVLNTCSIVGGTQGNCGKGVVSGVSGPAGDGHFITGDPKTLVNGHPTIRHRDLVTMNTKGTALLQSVGRAHTLPGVPPKRTKDASVADAAEIMKAQAEMQKATGEVLEQMKAVDEMVEHVNAVARLGIQTINGAGAVLGVAGLFASAPVSLGLGALSFLLPMLKGGVDEPGAAIDAAENSKNATETLLKAGGVTDTELEKAAEEFGTFGKGFELAGKGTGLINFYRSTKELADSVVDPEEVSHILTGLSDKALDAVEKPLLDYCTPLRPGGSNMAWWQQTFGKIPPADQVQKKFDELRSALKAQTAAAKALAEALKKAAPPPGLSVKKK